jgi:23S rRNA pseudouridine2604 synthase
MIEITSHNKEPVRINTFLRDNGVASRRAVDTYINNGNVYINGTRALVGGKVNKGDIITVKTVQKDLLYALYHKPKGEVTAPLTSLKECQPIGRLDKESEGLLLYSNDFRVVDATLNPKNKREKEYEVTVREKATPRVVTILKRGIHTQEADYAPVKAVSIYNEGYSLRIILTEGKKHEIRRMLNALNLTIVSLKRVRIMSFVLRGIPSGKTHILTDSQIKTLFKDLSIP